MALSQLVRNGFDEVAVVVHEHHAGFRDVGSVQTAAQNGVLQVPGNSSNSGSEPLTKVTTFGSVH